MNWTDRIEGWYKRLGEILAITPEVKIQEKIIEKEIIKEVEVPISNETPLEKYCSEHFREVPKFAYKDKGIFKDYRYPMYPNELIQPEVRLIHNCKKEIKQTKDVYKWLENVSKYVDMRLTWTSDEETTGHLDIYQDIYASVIDNRQDCETHAGVFSSIEPLTGIAFGFCGTTGHAWNVAVINDELYCIETNSTFDRNNNAKIFKYAGQKKYVIHYIFTQNKTFKCSTKRIHFGKLD